MKQENFSCNKKTNDTRRHFITYKNNWCQVFSRSHNDQPLFVNEYKVKVAVVFTKKQVFWISASKT